MEQYSRFYRIAFVAATVALLGWLLARLLDPLWGALGWAIVLGFLLYPAQVRLTRMLRHRRALAAGIITTLTPFVILAPLSSLGVMFARQVSVPIGYLSRNPGHLLSLQEVSERLARVPVVGSLWRWIQDNVPISADQVENWAESAAHAVLQGAATLSGSLVLGVAGSVVRFSLAVFLLFFVLRDGSAMLRGVVRLVPMPKNRLDVLLRDLITVLRAVVFGSVMTALLEGILVGVGWAIVSLPSPVVFGSLAGAAAFIPAVGIAAVVVPALLYLAVVGHWGSLIFLAIWASLVGLGENLARPMLTSRQAEIPALAVFIGVIGGVSAFGFIGVVIGPVLISLIITLIRQGGDWVQREA